jgi:FkbM family methyltransferase
MTTPTDQTHGTLALRVKRRVFTLVPARGRLPLRVWWMRLTRTLEPEVHEITRFVPPGGTALDIGANHGVYSYFMVRHFDRVVAYEPQPACIETLQSWAGDRVEMRAVALSDHAGESTLSIPVAHGVALTGYARLDDSAAPASGLQLEVPIERLDDQDLSDVRFVKIDVEGHELPVLRGGERLLVRDSPVLLVEIEQRHLGTVRTVGEVVDYVVSLGYRCQFRRGSRWVPFDQFEPDVDQSPRDVGTSRYVSMFLFLPSSAPLAGA